MQTKQERGSAMRVTRKVLALSVSLAAIAFTLNPAVAETTEPQPALEQETVGNIDKTAALPAAGDTLRLFLASELVVWGRRHQDPVALVTAADVLSQVGTQEADWIITTTGGEASDKTPAKPMTLASVIAEGRLLSADDEDLQDLLSEIEARRPRGPVGGPKQAAERIEAGAVQRFTVDFVGGEPASVYLIGDGDSDLDLLILDETDTEICAGTRNADRELCRWMPRWTGSFTIYVKNQGGYYNDYQIFAGSD